MYNVLPGMAGDEEGVRGCGVALMIEVAACEGRRWERASGSTRKKENSQWTANENGFPVNYLSEHYPTDFQQNIEIAKGMRDGKKVCFFDRFLDICFPPSPFRNPAPITTIYHQLRPTICPEA